MAGMKMCLSDLELQKVLFEADCHLYTKTIFHVAFSQPMNKHGKTWLM